MRSPIGFTLSLRRLLILLSGIGLLPLALLGLWSVHTANQHQQREQERAMLDLARALSSAVDAELDGSIATLASLARSPAIAAGDVRTFYDIARDQVKGQPEWLAIILTDAAGKILFRTTMPFGEPAGRIADPESLHQLLAVQRPLVGHVSRGQRGKVAFPVRVPLRDESGRLYALTAVIKPDRILGVVKRQAVLPGSVIAVIDAAGAIVARSKDHDKRVAGPAGPALQQLMRGQSPEGVGASVNYEGDSITSAFTKVSRHGWTVAVGVPKPGSGPASLKGMTLYGWGLGASLLACVGLASLLSIRIAKSFANLQQAAAALGAGKPVEVAASRIRELALMGRALEAAAAQHATYEQERSLLLASLEDALKTSREASVVKDEFLAVLGHELRNPLSPIVASLDLMDLRADDSSLRERTIMRRQVNHLKRLVDDLLDVARITSGKMQLELRPLNLAEVVRHAVASRPGTAVTLAAPAAVWVEGDESRLAQVLNNLLSNAERFGDGATRVTLGVDADTARLEVADNGIGMDRDLLARVFDPFYQAPQQAARITGGLGLGLAIVRKIVELHHGRVSARSDGPGTGSSFVVELPLAAAQAPLPLAIPHAPAGDKQVLVVDDNVDAATMTALILEQFGHAVQVAHSGAAALALLERYRPAVAILDIGLPDMDGYALAAAIRRTGMTGRLVALTGYGQKSDVERASAAGFDMHLTKPASLDDLARAVADTETIAP
ncbi:MULTISPECIES: ATP-binding protein [unclassified Massilia]|uniref:hybrid sensor histidine kinase/response regulator n=1 Tax=unclassified Massilia TaxID=2609279 RepID=UPI00177A7DFF|nr:MULTISPECIES: ATP-binding protein [unclassified Massilia]MBD8528886.1 response regulator [Massilia sp. CFBP 13647]MBD8673528.1 response regulator [Massilia sp. CFBP 13721]